MVLYYIITFFIFKDQGQFNQIYKDGHFVVLLILKVKFGKILFQFPQVFHI